jgi:hypothetical protein
VLYSNNELLFPCCLGYGEHLQSSFKTNKNEFGHSSMNTDYINIYFATVKLPVSNVLILFLDSYTNSDDVISYCNVSRGLLFRASTEYTRSSLTQARPTR